jgi:hypothetical protein
MRGEGPFAVRMKNPARFPGPGAITEFAFPKCTNSPIQSSEFALRQASCKALQTLARLARRCIANALHRFLVLGITVERRLWPPFGSPMINL